MKIRMTSRRRATLTGIWWRSFFKSIRNCHHCGGLLTRRYVAEEKTRRLVCERCELISYINPKVVAGLIPVMPDGRVALLKRDNEPARGKWSYPAGYMELGESVSEAAVRETMEEISVRARIGELLGVYSYPDAAVVTVVYLGRVRKGAQPAAGHESQEVRLFKKREIPWDELAFRSTKDALRDWTLL